MLNSMDTYKQISHERLAIKKLLVDQKNGIPELCLYGLVFQLEHAFHAFFMFRKKWKWIKILFRRQKIYPLSSFICSNSFVTLHQFSEQPLQVFSNGTLDDILSLYSWNLYLINDSLILTISSIVSEAEMRGLLL